MKSQRQNKKEIFHKKGSSKSKVEKTNSYAWWMSLIAVLPITFIVLYPCLQNGFTNWDDPTYIIDNPLIKELSAASIKKIFTEVYFSNYQPLHIFSYALEYHFFKEQATGYHAVSIIMHLINTSLVLWLVWLITGNLIVSVITCILFGIHPLHVESIAWAAERKDLLYAMFFFLSVIFYVKYIQSAEKTKFILYAFLFFVLSVFSKAMAASLPPVLVLIDFFYKRKIGKKVILEKIPFFILAVVMGLISVQASKETGSIGSREDFPFFERILFANHNLFTYFYKLLVPVNLSAYYPYPEKINGSLDWYYYAIPLLSIVLLLACFYSLKFTRIIFLCIGFFVITIFLVLQLLPVGPAVFSERYSYIPSVGFFLLQGWGIDWLLRSAKRNTSLKPLVWTVTSAWCLWLCVLTYQRCQVWKDSVTLWSNVINQFDKALHAYNNRADAYYKAGNYNLTVKDLNVAISLNDSYAMAWYNRGNAYGQLGKYSEAWRDLDRAITLDPKNANAYNKRGQANAVLGKTADALTDFNRALQMDPDNAEVYYNIGITWINNANKEEGCKALTRAVQMNYVQAFKPFNEICK